jgi:diguanylate cyclase (GGDEF)-like protein
VLILSLDHFRMVNDSLGHPASEELLAQVAGRLRSMVRASGRGVVVARTGEDEFGMLLTELRQSCDADSVARSTLELLREPYYIEGRRVPVGGSMGIAFGSPDEGPEELLRNAETAMYNASTKENGEFSVFNPGMRERAVARLDVVMGLRRAIEANQLRLHFQPLVSLRERRIIGFESLVRWQHPDRGLLPPAEFIPVAEESDLILEVGEWVLREACRQMAEWQERLAPEPPLTIGVNVSARQMSDPGFAELVRRVLAETGMDARRLRLEVTETSLATDSGQLLATLRALRRMDISMVIDDFGTGYSSLSYLQRLPFNTLKIDRSFTRELGAGDGSPEIVRTIIQLARTLKLKVVAEGVETADQVTRLTALGCDLVQGFYFGKPVDEEHTEALIRDRDALHPLFPYGGEGDYLTDEAENPSSAAQSAWMVDQSA